MAVSPAPAVKKRRLWKRFIIHVSLIVVLFLMGIFIGFAVQTSRLISEQYLSTARAHFKNIVLTRRWNAKHGGVFVKKGPDNPSNPYLENPDITAVDGTVYTMKNPALMTREISEYARQSGDFIYHITSLMPLNPGNAPDDFERDALKGFEAGDKEKHTLIRDKERAIYRYMAPLDVEDSCMPCHAKQGYRVGDVRGGISVTFDVTATEKKMARNQFGFIGLGIAAILLLLGIILFLILRLAGRLSDAYSTIEKMSITDDLTQVFNRRHFHTRLDEEIERARRYDHPMSLLMMDLDHFKTINDRYGHQTGDEVLRTIAAILRAKTRSADIVARYGGEEFVVILPETNQETAEVTAEKLLSAIKRHPFALSDGAFFHVTASFGVSSLDMADKNNTDTAQQIVKMADDAMYQAKQDGRNRVAVYSGM
ncbi:MAG: diguanylate cyclase [Desulfotignum sp.]|nr:diguanylate cyclase [Desulfotignum sp.]